ncbi:zinc finger protein 91 [Rhipicephalus sanguineus]|uniref:zinc finger protein 91 n=1 Tax=Rhipicephalus sanguineus TaxID=34632 RepID=UPI0018951203|nr:zinc finger protein 91 [Rhipicephalus sanguineus]
MQNRARNMTVKIFIDLTTQPFVTDLVFPEGLPKGGYVTLFVGCCQRTPQPGKLVDRIPLKQGASSNSEIPVVRHTCHNQTYTEFCDAKIYVRRESDENGGASFPCNLRHSFDSGVLTEQEHRRLHIQREVPELCGDITPIQKVWDCCDCQYCGVRSAPRDHPPHIEFNHSGLGQSCILCRRVFKNESTLLKHLCLHAQDGFHCGVCRKPFPSKDLCSRHVERNACSPAPRPEPVRRLEVLPAAFFEPIVVPPAETTSIDATISGVIAESIPDNSKSHVEVTDTATVTAGEPAGVYIMVSDKQGGSRRELLGPVRARQHRLPCPHCPRFCFSQAALQVHLRRKHISNAPLKCPHCPKRFFVDTVFYKHRSICMRKGKGKDVKVYVTESKNRWNRLNCEHCDFFTHRYQILTDHYAENHQEHALSTCETCQTRFAHHAYMLIHQVQVHCLSEENQPQACSLCDLTLDGIEGLRDHLLEVHLPAPIFRCFECYGRFSTYAAVLRHRNEKHNPKSSKCPDCPKTFKNALACRRHVLYTHYSSRLVNSCKLCFRRYKNLLELRYHMALSHINELSEEEKASLEPLKKHCAQCDYMTFNRRSMVGHMRRKHGEMLKCPQCPGRFAQVAELTRHQRLRHGSVGRQQCPHCPRSFVCPKLYGVHLSMHQEGRGHECTICRRLFESEAILKHHSDSHTSSSNRRCKACLRVFATTYHLAKHEKMYTTQSPDGTAVLTCPSLPPKVIKRRKDRRSFTLTCDQCHLRFKYQSSLSAHKMALHGKSSKDGRSLTCEICEESFVSMMGLSSHIRTHTGERPFSCGECGASFGQSSTLREHTVLKHSRAFRETCPLCSKGCVSKTKLRRHLQAAHKALLVCAQPAAPRRSTSSTASTPARAPQPATSDDTDTYLLPDLVNTEETYEAPEEEGAVLQEGELQEGELQQGMVPQVVAVTTRADDSNLAVAVDSIINLMVCDTLIETNCIELTSEEARGDEEC